MPFTPGLKRNAATPSPAGAGLLLLLLPLALHAYRPPDQRTIYDSWIADSQARRSSEARMKELWKTPEPKEYKSSIDSRLERESREAWEAGERRMRERREARAEAERAREVERQASERLDDAARAGDADALMTLGKRNESSAFLKRGLREYQRVFGPQRPTALRRVVELLRMHAEDGALDDFRSVDSFLAELADLGDVKAARQLAESWLKREDYYQAGKYFAQAGASGDVEAQQHAIRLVADDQVDAVPVSAELFYGWARDGAGRGDLAAQWVYGSARAVGGEISRDSAEAVALLRKVAELDPRRLEASNRKIRARAMNLSGLILLEGRGVAADVDAGLRLLQGAAEEGDVAAMLTLGRIYWVGKGVAADTQKATDWLKQAAEKENAAAAELLAAFYLQDDSPDFDEGLGVEWLRKASKRRPKAMIDYGRVLAVGDHGVARDPDEALACFSTAIERYPNDPDVLEFVGQSYVHGEYGLQENPLEGVRLLKLAVERGSRDAAQRLATLYGEGATGIARDAAEAKRWRERFETGN